MAGAALAGNDAGGYERSSGEEHYLPQVAIIDGRSFGRRTSRPPWERANSYIAPNAYDRAVPLGGIESFDCKPSGGEPASEARQSAVRGRPEGREGTEPATP